MEVEFTESGICIPKQPPLPPPQPPQHEFGSIEIQDPQLRAKAAEGMLLLWDAMRLTQWSSFDSELHEQRMQAYRNFGEAILGKDCPEKEQWC